MKNIVKKYCVKLKKKLHRRLKKNSKGKQAASERSRLEKNHRNGGLLGVKAGSICLNEEALVY